MTDLALQVESSAESSHRRLPRLPNIQADQAGTHGATD
jgi:hypothetical protein